MSKFIELGLLARRAWHSGSEREKDRIMKILG